MNDDVPLIKIVDGEIYRKSYVAPAAIATASFVAAILCCVLLRDIALQRFDLHAWYTPIMAFIALIAIPCFLTASFQCMGNESLTWRKVKAKGIPAKKARDHRWHPGPIKSL